MNETNETKLTSNKYAWEIHDDYYQRSSNKTLSTKRRDKTFSHRSHQVKNIFKSTNCLGSIVRCHTIVKMGRDAELTCTKPIKNSDVSM